MRAWLYKKWVDLAAGVLLLLLVIAFFYPLWGQGGWLPYGGGDAVSFLYPMYRFIASSLHNGEIPLWNPHQYAGYPLIADNQSGMFYPINLLLFWLHPNFSYQWMQLLVAWHIFWAGLGMYGCVRVLYPAPTDKIKATFPALFAAIAFMFSDLFITHLGNLNLIAVAAWLPWAFLTFYLAITRSQRTHLLTTGLIIGISTLAGHGQMTFYIALLLGLYALWQSVATREWRPLLALAIVGVIGFGLSALTLLPTYEMNALSRRGAFSYEQAVNYSLPWRGLVGLLAPGMYGRGALNFWAAWPRVEVGYVGAVTLILALLGVGKIGREDVKVRRKMQVGFFVVMGFLFLFLALGGNTPVYGWVLGWAQLPFQVPARFVLLLDFCLAILAARGVRRVLTCGEIVGKWVLVGWGVGVLVGVGLWLVRGQAVVAGHGAGATRAVVIFGLAATAAWLLVTVRGRWLRGWLRGALLVGVISAEIFATSQYIEVDWGNPLTGYQNEAATQFLQANVAINRIDEATGRWQASSAQVVGLYSAGGVFNPLELASHATLMGSLGYRGSPTYNLLGIKYIVADKSEPPGDTNFLIPVYAADPQVDIYLNTRALPRAMMLYQAETVASQDDAFAALFADHDFAQTVVVEQGEPLTGAVAAHQIEVVEYRNNHVVLDVQTEQRGYLLLTDMWYPNWQAEVDGVSAEIYRANYAFRAILLEPGSHRVEMHFQPRSWQIGLAISVVSWVLVIGGLVGMGLATKKKGHGSKIPIAPVQFI